MIAEKLFIDGRLPLRAKLFYYILAEMCAQAGSVDKSMAYFHRMCGVSMTAVTSWIDALETAGYIDVERFPGSFKKVITLNRKVITLNPDVVGRADIS